MRSFAKFDNIAEYIIHASKLLLLVLIAKKDYYGIYNHRDFFLSIISIQKKYNFTCGSALYLIVSKILGRKSTLLHFSMKLFSISKKIFHVKMQ